MRTNLPCLWNARSAYYLASTLTKQIGSGESYLALKPVVGIHLLNLDLLTEPEQMNQAHWCFEMRDSWQPSTKLGAELELNVIDSAKPIDCKVQQPKAWVPP